MNWSEERYVRLYTRNTSDWFAMCWQARCCFPLLLKAADRAGIVAVKEGPRRLPAVAGLLGVPVEVVAAAIADLLEDGCLVERECGFVFPRFIEAQEAEASDAKRAREYRERFRAKMLAAELLSPSVTPAVTKHDEPVTQRDEASRAGVTKSSPLAVPCLPSRAVPLKTAGAQAHAAADWQDGLFKPGHQPPKAKARKAKAEKPPPDPRHTPMVERLTEAFRKTTGIAYGFGSRDAKDVASLLALGTDDEIETRWVRALRNTGFPVVRSLSELFRNWNHFAMAATSNGRAPVRAEDIPKEAFAVKGEIHDF